MPVSQFNKKVSSNRWYLLTYQSNKILNDELHNQVKTFIAELLVDKFPIVDLHSYIHGNILFSINTNKPLNTFDEVVNTIKVPLTTYTYPLLFSLVIAPKTSTGDVNFMYISGSDEMDTNFRTSVQDFFPKKTSR